MAEQPFEKLAHLDKLVHEPARLALLTALSSCDRATFTFLRKLTGLTRGNLSSHLSTLDDAGFVDIDKRFEGNAPVTYVSLSDDGRRSIARYWDDLQAIRTQAAAYQPENASTNPAEDIPTDDEPTDDEPTDDEPTDDRPNDARPNDARPEDDAPPGL